jgi:ABC-type amino acid transport substrate-binding protein
MPNTMPTLWIKPLVAGCMSLLLVGFAHAQAWTGTLKKAHATGAVTLGYRDASIPFSYLSVRGEPIGYAIEICRALVDAMGQEIGRELQIKWLPVTSETRFSALTSGQVDLECGSTTNNVERQKVVDFSPTTFVSGTRLMVKNGSSVTSFRDLVGKRVGVTAGTTNEKTLRDLSDKFKLKLQLVVFRDHAESFAQLAADKVDAFATDEILLYGLLAQHKAQAAYAVVGEFLSYEPYGIMYRKGDAQLAEVVNKTFATLADDADLDRLYTRWFLRRLPSGVSINLPMSPQLRTIFQSLAMKPE